MVSYVVREATTRDEFDALIDVVWKANHDPYEPAFSAFFPVFGPTAADREAAVLESKERLWQMHRSEHSSHWIYVRDPKSGEVVGCTEWVIYETNPYANGVPEMEATWWPEGSEGRAFSTELIRQIYAPRLRWMKRPHLALNWTAVHPKYRHRGIGKALMSWGVDRARELGVESFIEASAMGRFLYESCGYRVLFKIGFDGTKIDPSDEWRRLEHDHGPVAFYAMWRPASGVFEDGKTVLPWDIIENTAI